MEPLITKLHYYVETNQQIYEYMRLKKKLRYTDQIKYIFQLKKVKVNKRTKHIKEDHKAV